MLPLDEQNSERIMVRLKRHTKYFTKQMSKRTGVKHAELLRILIENEVERLGSITDVSQIRSR